MDTNFYKSPFVRGLKGPLKTLYSFIICDCTGAGIWTKDLPIASAYIGFEISENDFAVFVETGKALDLKDGKFFFPDFIEHQYPKGLQEKNPAHKNFILELKKYNLIDEELKPLWRGFEGSQVIVTVKETVKDKVTVKESDEKKLIFPFTSKEFMQVWETLVNEKKWRKKSITALQASLKKLSNYPESEAIEMMENTIAGGWQGLFEIDKRKYGKQQPDKLARLKQAIENYERKHGDSGGNGGKSGNLQAE